MSIICNPTVPHAFGNMWEAYNGDSVELCGAMPDNSIDYSISSWPFASLYTFSSDKRDMSNCRDMREFMRHVRFLVQEQLRILKPGRNMSIHCMDLPTSKMRDGHIGIVDFPGFIIRTCERAGFIWHSRVTIWKDPATAMQRTKALGLLWKQLKKDSAMSRMALPDYVLTFRKPGENANPIDHTPEDFPVEMWERWASPVWTDIDPGDTLQRGSAREEKDERHISLLQLEVYRRCIELWSRPGECVLEPFGGIGSGGHVALGGKTRSGMALRAPRRVVLCELKPSYYAQAVANMRAVEPGAMGEQFTLINRQPTQRQDPCQDGTDSSRLVEGEF